jgi:ATP-binding cassette subfamily F protein 3
MLTIHDLAKTYGGETILAGVSFDLSANERAGLIGPNGAGKSTLLRIIAGVEGADAGHIQFAPSDLRAAYLPQGLSVAPDETLSGFLARGRGDLLALMAELERLAEALTTAPARTDLQSQYDSTLSRLGAATEAPARQMEILAALGLGAFSPDTPVRFLSGGQKTRLALASVLLDEPQLLLLDEPTNHLDIAMLEWLEGWLNAFRGAALIVSHDRTFLDHTVTRILELDAQTHGIRAHAGNYTDYLEQKVAERERQWQEWRDQEAEVRRLRQDIAATKEQARWVEVTTTPRQPNVRRYAKKVAKKALSREKKLDRFLASDERVEKPSDSWQMKLDFGATPASGQDVLVTEDLSVGFRGPATESLLLRALNLHVRHGERIALVGPNGAGKTTLLRTIAGQVPPLGGRLRLGANVRLGYMAQEQEVLAPSRSALSTIRDVAPLSETDARHFLHLFLFTGDDVFTPIESLSFGERARLMLATLVARGSNFLLLDEPINHLDIPSRARFEQALAQFAGTVLAVVHDRYFIERFASRVWQCADGTITEP